MLTLKQREMFLFIHRSLTERGLAPTYEEMMKELGIKSKGQVNERMNALINRGLIKRYKFYSRGIEVVKFPEYLRSYVEYMERNKGDEEAKKKSAQIYERFTELAKECKAKA